MQVTDTKKAKKAQFTKKYLFFVIFIALVFIFLGFAIIHKKDKFFYVLEKEINNFASSTSGEIYFLIKDLSFPYKKLSLKESTSLPAASLIKLPLLAVAAEAMKENKILPDELVTIEKKDVAGGSGIIKGMDLPIKLTFQKICELSITHSDNTATNKIIDILGFDYINDGFTALGLKHTRLKRKMMDFYERRKGTENYTSASDIAVLLEKIYRKKIVNVKMCGTMLSFLKKQKVNDRLPRYLPRETIIAHKTGLEKGITHDAGIIFSPKGDYIICVLTKGMNDQKKTKKIIAQISLLAYNLYQKH